MNRLAHAISPCLLQHADNPVDWWPWSPEAFEQARRRGVPILLKTVIDEIVDDVFLTLVTPS